VNRDWLGAIPRGQWCDLQADLSDALPGLPPGTGDDESLVRELFLALLPRDPRAATQPDRVLADWTPYVQDTWLKPVFAEAMITAGAGNPERWASYLSPQAFQDLRDRVDLDFPATNPTVFRPGDDVTFDVILKNTPQVLVRVFELNTLHAFQTRPEPLNTDVELEGLVANAEQTHRLDSTPFQRVRRSFSFPELKGRRGAWILEFIGGGRSSRALVRVGQWDVLQETGPAGVLLQVHDEDRRPVPDAVAWLDGRKFTPDPQHGRIVIPFTADPRVRPLVVGDAAGAFASLTEFEHAAESYSLDARFHLEREQLLSRRQATLATRVHLLLGETRLDPALLEDARLVLTALTRDGVASSTELSGPDLRFAADSAHLHAFPVPDRLASLSATLTARIPVLSAGGEPQELAASASWTVNGLDDTASTSAAHLSRFGDTRVFELLGKNGEPLPDRAVTFAFRHRDFAREQSVSLRTDARGRIALGPLPDIARVQAALPDGSVASWILADEDRTVSSTVHARAGTPVRLPASARATAGSASLLELRAATFAADRRANVSLRDGFWVLEKLEPGDYSFRAAGDALPVSIRVTAADEPVVGWLLGPARHLQDRSAPALHLVSVSADAEFLTVRLAHASPAARVHVAATRFTPSSTLFASFGGFPRFGLGSAVPPHLPNLFSGGREIGDEYRYILDRRRSRTFPGTPLARPGILLNPWETRDTGLDVLATRIGEAAGATAGARGGAKRKAAPEPPAPEPSPAAPDADANLDFLAAPAPVLWNLVPDAQGVVRVPRAALGDRQHLQVLAADLEHAAWRSFALPETDTKRTDLRLARILDPARPHAARRDVTVLAPGQSLAIADRLTAELETYASLADVHALFATLSGDPRLADFAFLLRWPSLTDDEKRARYGEFAGHELHLFLARKDPKFFDAVVRPYLAHKLHPDFLDDHLLGRDLSRYREPWAYGRLNAAERCLLALRVPEDAPFAARRLREHWELLPPDPEREEILFEAALAGRALEHLATGALEIGAKDGAGALALEEPEVLQRRMAELSAPAAPPLPAPAMAPAASAPMDRFADLDEEEEPAGGRARSLATDAAKPQAFGLVDAATARAARTAYRPFYRTLGPTKEWAEANYDHVRRTEQSPDLVPVNAFWRDCAAWIAAGAQGPFLSPHFPEAATSGSVPEMLLALALLDLPFEGTAPESKETGPGFTLTAKSPLIVFHRELKPVPPAPADAPGPSLLVTQSFFRHDDRYRLEGNERFEKPVTGEFLAGVVYGTHVVVTNPSASPAKGSVLLQIPRGALPVLGAKPTDIRTVRLEPYSTTTFEQAFYFPEPPAAPDTTFPHFPVHVTTGDRVAAAAPTVFTVVAKPSRPDTASWDHVSQNGTEAEVFAFLDARNLGTLDLERVAWRCRESVDFYRKLTAFLRARHVWSEPVARYALFHDDAPTLREWLRHRDDFVARCGPAFASPLLTLDPVERGLHEPLDYAPLVNPRAHRLGPEWRLANPDVLAQYRDFLDILAHRPAPDAADQLRATGFLFLQDRTEEALARLQAIDARSLDAKLQHDYFRCYAALLGDDLPAARGIASVHANHPVPRWRALFADALAYAAAAAGQDPAPAEPGSDPGRESAQAALAASEPTFDFRVEDGTLKLTWRQLDEVTLNFYLMDLEFSFSGRPFAGEDSDRFRLIRPNRTVAQRLPAREGALDIPLPPELATANVLVEVAAAGKRHALPHHANRLRLLLSEDYGRLDVRDRTDGRPLPKVYVKVYARLQDGSVRFYKDGYTDLRGHFDYASLNGPGHPDDPVLVPSDPPQGTAPSSGLDHPMLRPDELGAVDRLSLLVLSDAHGALVREVPPPSR
jgi:hypothetical protein